MPRTSWLSSVMKRDHPWQAKHTVVHYRYPKGIIIISRRRVSGSNQMGLEEAQLIHIDCLFPIFLCACGAKEALPYCTVFM